MKDRVIAVDIGTTNVKAYVVDSNGSVLGQASDKVSSTSGVIMCDAWT